MNNLPVAKTSIIADVNLDMIALRDTSINGIAALVSARLPEKISGIIKSSNDPSRDLPLNWSASETSRARNSSDHYSFFLKNIPAVFFITGGSSDIHTPGDDAWKIDYDYYCKATRSVYEIVYALANDLASLKVIK